MRTAIKVTTAASFFLAFFFVGTYVGWAVAQSTQEDSQSERPIHEMRRDMKSFLQRSKSDVPEDKAAAVYDLCILHHEVVTDSRFENNRSLVSVRAVVGNRLKKCKREYELAELRAERERKKQNRVLGIEEGDKSFEVDAETSTEYVLASTMAEYLHYTGSLTGGPAEVFTYANGNFAPGDAQDLIRLIETTINPATWRTNGGSGDMFWYRPACALVVSASAQTQDQISDLLRQMRVLNR
jgi:hypothetical protein